MKPRDKFESSDADFDELDAKIHQALKEKGAVIPTSVEDVRRAKARLKARPVTVPPHLRDPAVIRNPVVEDRTTNPIETIPVVLAGICREEDKSHVPVSHKKGTVFFRRAAFDAYVVHCLTDDENLGRTKIEKITHLTEYHCGIDFQREPLRDAAGPVDYVSRRKVESLAKKQKWYSAVEAENRWGVKYVPGSRLQLAQRYFDYEATAAARKELPQMGAYLQVISDDARLSHEEKMKRVHAVLFGGEQPKSGGTDPTHCDNGD